MEKNKEMVVKVTRLSRRQSNEPEGTQSPATPSTPTKKRGTKLTKPPLELIDENVTENVPKRITRKMNARDAVEPAEEKVVTPSRRSARIRSNASLVMEATQSMVESPRAKRATRRNSQIESDTETATTPARQNRRTRKDSTSSVEKLAVSNINEKITVQVAEVITEEPEKEIEKDPSLGNTSNQSPKLRKSPRHNKKGNKSIEPIKNINEKLEKQDKSLSNTSKLADETLPEPTIAPANISTEDKSNNKLESNDSRRVDLSLTSANLLNEIETKPKRPSVFSKTITEIAEIDEEKTVRKRTKSWTTITTHVPTSDDDNQTKLGSGDYNSASVSNVSIENKENINYLKSLDAVDAGDTLKLLEKTPSKNIQSVVFIEDSDSNSGSTGKLIIDIQNEGQHSSGDDQCVPIINQPIPNRSVSESFAVEPMDIDETIPGNVTINDFSDKTNSSREEDDLKRESSISDQKLNESSNKSKRTSSISLQQESNNSKQNSSSIGSSSKEFKSDSRDTLNKLNRSSLVYKSSTTMQIEHGENLQKCKRKSSLSKGDTENDKLRSSVGFQIEDNENVITPKNKSVSKTDEQNLEKTSNENKSTLVLSQLKDVSENEMSNVSKSHTETHNDLSKSMNILAKETDKKILSLNLLTSTPLQQKPLQKVAMQINTSIISPNAANKNNSKVDKTKSPKEKDLDTVHNSDSSSDEDVINKSNLIDDEAEEVCDNYESGDSRNDEDKQYEIEHEIEEKGETLESEQDFSDDSDYEKDSFIVSSDDEDDDLLSGSGDDLSLSDNELKMTTKSKKKFNDRKRKEQKKASKEMYQARHNLNESDKSSKIKKPKRQRLDSSVLESEKEDEGKPKKKNRLRIDSSQEISLNTTNVDKSISIKKKKVKRLSESICEENVDEVNEKEITVFNQSVVEINDPLSVAIKLEPKTPQKELNMSAVLINDNIEEVQMDANASIMKSNHTSDPLQATLDQENDESDSDISENMEIKESYDSILQILNETNNKQKRIKTMDMSLNLNKKTKDKVREPTIVDQLNLTKIKKSKKNKKQVIEDDKITEEPQPLKNDEVSAKMDDSEASDSIDMRLLFPEDGNDSEANATMFKIDEKQAVEPEEQFIPLKRTEAKTNIHDSMDLNVFKNEPELNGGNKKKRKLSQRISEDTITDEPEKTEFSFFIDTKGNYEEDRNISTQSSVKKQKKKSKENLPVDEDHKLVEADETLAEISGFENASANVSQKKKKKKKNKSFDISETGENPVEPTAEVSSKHDKNNDSVSEQTSINVSLKSEKKKKKNNKSFDVSQIGGEETVEPTTEFTNSSFKTTEETPIHESLKSDKKKKKSHSFDVSHVMDNAGTEEIPDNIFASRSEKKKKKNKSLEASQIVDNTGGEPKEGPFVDVSFKAMKTKQSDMAESVDTELNVSTNTDKKKKKKNKSLEISHIAENTVLEETENVSQKSEKKKKKKKNTHDFPQIVDKTGEESDEAPLEVPFKIEKFDVNIPDSVEDDNTFTSGKNKSKKKKKKDKISTQLQTDKTTVNAEEEVKSKKRKREVISTTTTDAADDEIKILNTQKKKLKISQNDEDANAPTEENIKKKSKKRKATEDDYSQKKSKVFKENSFDKIHVPRLPESIVNQLDDQRTNDSKKQEKIKAIATVPFVVEETKKRKNKPSNYLEQSIYLNDTPVKQKQKSSVKNPKVLPFIPTAITSGKGYTSQFKINVLPQETEFIAQASDMTNFKNEYLASQRIKKLKTFERFKRHRNYKLSKF